MLLEILTLCLKKLRTSESATEAIRNRSIRTNRIYEYIVFCILRTRLDDEMGFDGSPVLGSVFFWEHVKRFRRILSCSDGGDPQQ